MPCRERGWQRLPQPESGCGYCASAAGAAPCASQAPAPLARGLGRARSPRLRRCAGARGPQAGKGLRARGGAIPMGGAGRAAGGQPRHAARLPAAQTGAALAASALLGGGAGALACLPRSGAATACAATWGPVAAALAASAASGPAAALAWPRAGHGAGRSGRLPGIWARYLSTLFKRAIWARCLRPWPGARTLALRYRSMAHCTGWAASSCTHTCGSRPSR